jgi:hypothetical protein
LIDLGANCFIDWDFLKNPICIDKIIDNAKLPSGIKRIILERDENYNLKCTLNFQDYKFAPQRDDVAGTFDKGFNIEGSSIDGALSYLLESCHIGGTTLNGQSEFIGTANLTANKLTLKCSENTPTHLTEWYVNGPNDHIFGSAQGKVIQYYTREHFLADRAQPNATDRRIADGFTTQFIWGKHKQSKFLITKIPFGPKWSTNVGIEYRDEWGGIPPPNERMNIEEISSFVFGKHLLSVGYTAYDKNEDITEVSAHSPWGQDAKTFCSNPGYPPIRIRNYPPGDTEKIIDYLLPKYIELSESLCLQEALWSYWISFDIPPGINLPVIASAIETMIHPWYQWKRTRSKGQYLERNEYINLLKDEIESIKRKLAVKYDINNKPEQKRYYEQIIDLSRYSIFRGFLG